MQSSTTMAAKNPLQQKLNPYIRYSSLGFQMIGVILIMALIGKYADGYAGFSTPWLTTLCLLFGVGSSMYLLLKDLRKSMSAHQGHKQEDEEQDKEDF